MIKIEVSGVQQLQNHLTAAAVAIHNPQPVLKMAGLLIKREVQGNFMRSATPDGTPWPPLKRPRTRPKLHRSVMSRRSGIQRPLIDTGALMNGINYETTENSVRVATSAQTRAYAAAQNFGYAPRNLPARTYMGIGERTLKEIIRQIQEFAVKALRFGGGSHG